MMNRISNTFRQKEGGFLLVEVMIAVIIACIVAIGASVMIIQLLNVKATNANTTTTTKNIESAAHWLVRDVQMSEIAVAPSETDGQPDVISGIGSTETEWLWLEWTWDDGLHRVEYEIVDGKLYRSHWIGTSLEGRTMVAECIDAGGTHWELLYEMVGGESTNLTVELTLTATTGGYKSSSQTRTIQVEPRITN